MGGYILDRNGIGKEEKKTYYRQEELELMTTHQLREICRREKIIQGILNPMDKEELVHVILRFRGKGERMLIAEETEDGNLALGRLLEQGKVTVLQDGALHIPSKIVVYEGLSMDENDGIHIPYRSGLEDTNAVLVDGGKTVCGIFRIKKAERGDGRLYVVKSAGMPCRESDWKDYDLYCFPGQDSDRLCRFYRMPAGDVPEGLHAYRIPLLDVEVRKPIPLRMPLAVDFGSTNTTAGVYLDSLYFESAKGAPFAERFEKNAIQYTVFGDGRKMVPTVVGVTAVERGEPRFVFGQEALDLSRMGYVDEGFSIFRDMKRWVSDYEREEEITDRSGRRTFLARKEIIRAFFGHVIRTTENRFKCRVGQLHVSCPVRQKFLFQKLFREILPKYVPQGEEMLDEGVSVLYNTVSGMLASGQLREDRVYQGLVVDCGGGTTDLCACRFRFRDEKVAYHIRMETAYENGDTDFGGNNLTYRIMQYIKILLSEKMGFLPAGSSKDILRGLDTDVFRCADAGEPYRMLEEAYGAAEQWIPTKFREYESRSREEYFMVKNNFHHLFSLAEQVKKHFYEKAGILRVGIVRQPEGDADTAWVEADKWKLSVRGEKGLRVVKEFPSVTMNLYEMGLVVRGDIYGIIRKFMEPLYAEDRLKDFSFLKLTGQSCKIDIFRDALKEFIPGRMIQFRHGDRGSEGDSDLKMGCVDGALKFIRDRRLGYARVELGSDMPVLPYTVSAKTHNGREVELVNGFLREEETRYVSRNLEDVTLYLYLKDTEGKVRYHFCFDCEPSRFRGVTYGDIRGEHGQNIMQKDTDSIANGEIRFFAWKQCREWGYVIVPVCRRDGRLYMGDGRFYPFEHEGWVGSFFDGMK